MKLKNYNFDLSPQELSSEQINRHKDFDSLMGRLEESSPKVARRPRRMLFYISGAVAAALIGFFVYSNFSDATNYYEDSRQYFASQAYINPPQLNVSPQYYSHTFQAEKGTIHRLESGSQLDIPASAFIDGQGQIVRGQVAVKYREFHDYVDFFLSGIPMEYDSAGVQYLMESVGMIEIYAEKDGSRINVAPGKDIKVALVSEINIPLAEADRKPNYNVYLLDVDQRNWTYKGKDNIEILSEERPTNMGPEDVMQQKLQRKLKSIEQSAKQKLAAVEAEWPTLVPPVKPERANEDDPVFSFNFTDKSSGSQELADQYANTMWQLNPDKNPNFNRGAAASIDWEDMKLRALPAGDFELTLIHSSNQMKLIVNPVLTGEDFNKAMRQYNEQLQQYQQQLQERAAAMKAPKDKIEKEAAQARLNARQEYETELASYKGNQEAPSAQMVRRKILNKFTANSFGIWNCDRPSLQQLATVKGEFVDTKKKSSYLENTAYLVDKSRNTVRRFYTGKGVEVSFNQQAENLLWLVTADNQIAVMRPEEFKRISKSSESYATFIMNVVNQDIRSEEDVRSILEF
ncbi:MAG: hypothetical protein AAFV25_10910 [Bacteroidota bacterium]